MTSYLVLSPAGVAHVGDSLFAAVFSTDVVKPDYDGRCVRFRGARDGVQFSGDPVHGYHGIELNRELAARAMTLLKGCGYRLFTCSDE